MLSLRQKKLLVARPWLVLGAALAFGGVRPAEAHEGPPFPLLMDQPVAGYSVSVWTDPDIGDALFYVVVETPEGRPPDTAPKVSMWTEPTSGRLPPVHYEANRQRLRNRVQFEAKPYFDQRDLWKVGFRIEPAGGQAGELVAEVESTPPGYGVWDFAIYVFPFLFLAGMWAVGILRRSRAARHTAHGRGGSPRDLPRQQPALAESASKDG
jgi:hypothetical protein